MSDIKDCCKDETNLVAVRERDDLVISTCQVCGCRQIELTVDPGVLGLIGANVG